MTGLYLIIAVIAALVTSGQCVAKEKTLECKAKKEDYLFGYCYVFSAEAEDVGYMKIAPGPGNTCAPGTYRLSGDSRAVFIKVNGTCGGKFIVTFRDPSTYPSTTLATTKAPKYTLLPEGTRKPVAGCGVNTGDKGFRIIGGQIARECQYPWMVRIVSETAKGTSYCGGSIIDSKHILTAGHCVTQFVSKYVSELNPYKIRINSGSTNSGLQTSRKVKRLFVHSGYKKSGLDHDIAVLRLTQEIKFDSCTSPVCLTKDQRITEGRSCRVMGWGRTNPYLSTLPKVMKWIEDPMESPVSCAAKYYTPYPETVVCGSETSFCSGDSGGPYVCLGAGNKYYQYGVVSTHKVTSKCKGQGKYTFVPYYIKWIDRQINSN